MLQSSSIADPTPQTCLIPRVTILAISPYPQVGHRNWLATPLRALRYRVKELTVSS